MASVADSSDKNKANAPGTVPKLDSYLHDFPSKFHKLSPVLHSGAGCASHGASIVPERNG